MRASSMAHSRTGLEELEQLTRALRAHVVRRVDLGESVFSGASAREPAAAPAAVTPRDAVLERHDARAPAALASAGSNGSAPSAATLDRARAARDLDELRAAVAACTACSLCRTRTQTVFSDGASRARVMFIGEAPGAVEDEQGLPFVGPAGRLLTDIIEKGMRLARSEVYIANVLKCRPPDNREPAGDEKALCTPYLDRQIELVNPEVLIPLGLHAAQHVLKTPSSMGRLRGRVHLLDGRKVVPTYHPAFLLRNPGMKKACWEDIQLAMRELGLPGKDAR